MVESFPVFKNGDLWPICFATGAAQMLDKQKPFWAFTITQLFQSHLAEDIKDVSGDKEVWNQANLWALHSVKEAADALWMNW